jgi:uncharacterized membrane protein
MNATAPRSIAQYLDQLRAELAGEDPALVQDALYDAEEYLRAEVAAHPGKTEADVLELIASTYGAPEEVAAAYRDTEAKLKVAMAPPPPRSGAVPASALRRFFGVFGDVRAWTSLFFMLLSLVTGIFYFTFAVVGVSMSAGLAILIVGVPFFLGFIGLMRVLALGEGRLLEAVSGERMPRRPVHPGPPRAFLQRMLDMLRDARTWTTLAYFVLMLPLGTAYFVIAVTGSATGLALAGAGLAGTLQVLGLDLPFGPLDLQLGSAPLDGPGALLLLVPCMLLGILVLTLTMQLARAIGRGHARLAKALLVTG